MNATKPVHIADRAYTRSKLEIYDFVLGAISGSLWGCSRSRVLAFYNQHVSGNHLDVGVGSGYFLDHCRYPVSSPRIVLLDPNPDPLEYCARRLGRYNPQTIQGDVLRPVVWVGTPFESVALNHLVHCLPGTMRDKAAAFRNVERLMAKGAALFGATVLGEGVSHNWVGRKFLERMNEKGVLDNRHDTSEGLKQALGTYFAAPSVEIVGRTALFWARKS